MSLRVRVSRDLCLNFKVDETTQGAFTLLTSRFLNSQFFVSPFYTCPKNPELSASTKLRDFLDRYCACPTISYFFLRSGVLTTACVCVCVCVMYVCACLCVCSRMCVCLTQMSSFSNFDIIVLDWGAYKCVCVNSVCVCLTRASSL